MEMEILVYADRQSIVLIKFPVGFVLLIDQKKVEKFATLFSKIYSNM
jgi:hypothetical protein